MEGWMDGGGTEMGRGDEGTEEGRDGGMMDGWEEGARKEGKEGRRREDPTFASFAWNTQIFVIGYYLEIDQQLTQMKINCGIKAETYKIADRLYHAGSFNPKWWSMK